MNEIINPPVTKTKLIIYQLKGRVSIVVSFLNT
jgi:hypothetical protein